MVNVERAIADVSRTYSRAISDLERGWTTAEESHYIRAIRSLDGALREWAEEGRASLKRGTEPRRGWDRWSAQRNHFIDAIGSLKRGAAFDREINIEKAARGTSDDLRRIAKVGTNWLGVGAVVLGGLYIVRAIGGADRDG